MPRGMLTARPKPPPSEPESPSSARSRAFAFGHGANLQDVFSITCGAKSCR